MSDDIRNEESEKDFNEWLKSIEFVNKRGKIIENKLYPDESSDPEGDRGKPSIISKIFNR